jgi:Fur family ferric uptake transcriptional regulator
MYKDQHSILRERGLKATANRAAVLDLLESGRALSARQITESLRRLGIDPATVYRTLESFLKAGLVRRVELRKDHFLYELAGQKHHHHLVCEQCAKVVDVDGCGLDRAEKRVLKQTGFSSIRDHALEFYGVCANCAKNNP